MFTKFTNKIIMKSSSVSIHACINHFIKLSVRDDPSHIYTPLYIGNRNRKHFFPLSVQSSTHKYTLVTEMEMGSQRSSVVAVRTNTSHSSPYTPYSHEKVG